ncbi:MAG: hypothetical protein COA86_08045 [Kangiella sp.]|nr:MAG: hypothetical protein COA86_08045 [Kangiella sp.]
MKKLLKNPNIITVAAIVALVTFTGCSGDTIVVDPPNVSPPPSPGYEVWAADQANSVAGQSLGRAGSYIYVWDSADIDTQVAGGLAAQPLGCDGNNVAGEGPCDLSDVFLGSFVEDAGADGVLQDQGANEDAAQGATGRTLGDSDTAIGRIHGMLVDPQNMYLNVNAFAPGAGYVGIMDARTKEAVALFRVTKSNLGRSVHMSFWSDDGNAILVANLHGRLLERIDITRDAAGNITGANFNRSASLSTQGLSVTDDATAFTGINAQGNALVSTVSGTYSDAALAAETPNGNNKVDGTGTGIDVGRPSGIIICPIMSDTDLSYITLAGGGLLIANTKNTPMDIVAEYSNNDTVGGLNGVGCGGVQVRDTVWLNAGSSAGGAGATQSIFTMYTLPNSAFDAHVTAGTVAALNTPAATLVFKDADNTSTGGNMGTFGATNDTGQIPGVTTRRDAHGMIRTNIGNYIHNADRVQNTVEVFSATGLGAMNAHVGSYDLTSADGQGNGLGACNAASVTDGGELSVNDPAPDLMGVTPDGKYLVVALRGPAPVTVTHSAQGSCPGVGVIALQNGGASGSLVAVLRTYNIVDDAAAAHVGGTDYVGAERSDPHGASARSKVSDGQGGFH